MNREMERIMRLDDTRAILAKRMKGAEEDAICRALEGIVVI